MRATACGIRCGKHWRDSMPTETLERLVAEGALKLGDGYRTRQSELGRPGVPILRVAEVLDGRLAPSYKDHISENLRPAFRQKTSRPGDVVLTTKGTVGRVAQIPAELPEFVYSPQLCFFRVLDTRRIDPRWLYYWFRSGEFKAQAATVQDQTDMAAYINLVDLRRMRITVPPLATQQAVADVLAVLDQKIACNARLVTRADDVWRNHLVERLRLWEGRVEDVPGWSQVPLSSIARFINGRNFTKGATGFGRMVVRIADLNTGPGQSTVYSDVEVPSDHAAAPGDLLFAWSGSLVVQRWFRSDAAINQHIFKVVPIPHLPLWLVHGYLLELLPWYRRIAADKATTMGHIQRQHLDVPVVLPDDATVQQLDKVCRPLWDRALAAERESLVLARLRDFLLPRLLSGDIRVRRGAALAEEAV